MFSRQNICSRVDDSIAHSFPFFSFLLPSHIQYMYDPENRAIVVSYTSYFNLFVNQFWLILNDQLYENSRHLLEIVVMLSSVQISYEGAIITVPFLQYKDRKKSDESL